MEPGAKSRLRGFLKSCLVEHGDTGELQDADSLFVSGRLDSLAMTNVVIYLEQAFGVDFADVSFDVDLIDSVQEIESFLREAGSR